MDSTQDKQRPGRARRWWFALACFITLIALFYAVENWRGKRAWEQCRRELQAKGAILDWSAYIPPPVPDDQNAYKAPGMHEWFVKEGPWTTPSIPSVPGATFSA